MTNNKNNILVCNSLFKDTYINSFKKLFITFENKNTNQIINFVFDEGSLLDFDMIFNELNKNIISTNLIEVSTGEIIDKYSKKISKIVHESDNGLYDAMNKGINLSTGEVIGILNSDDYFYPNALQIVSGYFQKNTDIDFLFGSVNKYNKIYSGYHPRKLYWTFGFYSSHSVGFFIKRKSQLEIGYYNTKYKYSADYDLFYRMIIKNKMKGLATKNDEVIGYFRSGGLTDKIKYIDYEKKN